MSNSLLDLPIATLEKALAIRKEIEALQASFIELIGGVPEIVIVSESPTEVDGRKGKRSPAARAKMAASQRARWAKVNGSSPAAVKPAKGAKKKRKMSPEGRARIVAALKARWAKKRGESTPAKSAVKAPKKRRTMSPEARAKIAAAQRARWAKQKAA